MPIPKKYLAEFSENSIYHVFNRTNNKELLFLKDENRRFFLKQYEKYITPVADTFCWCLLPNHFHFLIRLKPIEEVRNQLVSRVANLLKVGNSGYLSKTENRFLKEEISLGELVEFYFKSFFQSYSLAFNKVNKRKGNLFYKPFKRVLVVEENHFTRAVIYIHTNPLKHNISNDFAAYQWSSWNSLMHNKPTWLCKQELLDWFGGMKQFIAIHNGASLLYNTDYLLIEDG
jgi:putative transposase